MFFGLLLMSFKKNYSQFTHLHKLTKSLNMVFFVEFNMKHLLAAESSRRTERRRRPQAAQTPRFRGTWWL